MENIYNPEYVKGLFNRMSSSYERMNYITSFGFSIRWRRQFLQNLPPTNETIEIIDLLTGMGETWSATKKRFPNSNFTALDFSDGMLHYSQQKNKRHFKGEVVLLQQDILNNQLPSNHYDVVTCAFGLKTFNEDQLEILAKEIKRILKKGGKFTFIEVSKPDHFVLNKLFGFYLHKIIPVLGFLFLGNPDEYKMLWRYTIKFGTAQKAKTIFTNAGLTTSFTSYFYGCASGIYGTNE